MPIIIDNRIAHAVLANRTRILEFLKAIVEHSSASVDKAGVDWIGERITREMPRGFTRDVVRQDIYGNHLIFSRLRPPRLPVVLGGHMDTICPPGFEQLTPDGDRLRGPATADMKGGLVVLIWALKVLEQEGLLENIPVVCIFNSDEEINSPTSSDLFAGMRGKASAGIIFECAGLNNSAVTTRRGILVYDLAIKGQPGHAGLYQGAKVSAIKEAANKVMAIESLNRPDGSVRAHVGMINGGIAYNAIPEDATVTFELRYWDPAVGEKVMNEVQQMVTQPSVPGCSLTLKRRTFRPPMRPDANAKKLFRLAQDVAASLGQSLPPEERGGGSDASWLAYAGIQSIDGLGPIGANDFTDQEYIVTESLFQRIVLTANLLLNLDYLRES
ncbi:MAG: M20/M25/M40 family metallo-hydrolase [Kiritimatiellae bacterium]|nr:M20/M25/M40 family metallo-hydrolase [Kiritimatiellia bacterium]